MTLSRAKFNELTADLVEKTMGPVRQALLSDSGLSIGDMSKVLLVGGSSRRAGGREELHRQGPLQGHQPRRCWEWVSIQAGVLARCPALLLER